MMMSQKDRIIELVKQNVITMDEAITLLEAVAKTNATEESAEVNQFFQSIETGDQKETEAKSNINEDSKVDIKSLKENLSKKKEALVIANQRLRELEIFAELDELTPEMSEQSQQLVEKIATLQDEVADLEAQISAQIQGSAKEMGDQVKKIIEETTEQVTKYAKQWAGQASKESESLQQSIKTKVKEVLANVDTKTIQVNVPWVKSTQQNHTFTYPSPNIEKLDIQVINGSVKVEPHSSEEIQIQTEITFYGKEAGDLVSRFVELNTIDQTEDTLIFHVNSPLTAADLTVYVPEKEINQLTIKLLNGDLKVKQLLVKNLHLDNKNGKIKAKSLTADFCQVGSINGDIQIKESHLRELDVKNLNGEVRYQGQIESMVADVVSGDIVVSLINEDSSRDNHLKLKTVAGDIKVAVGDQKNLQVNTSGSDRVHQRVSQFTRLENGQWERHLLSDAATIKLELKTSTGDIYIKD